MTNPASPFSDSEEHKNSDLSSIFSNVEGIDHTVFNEHLLLQALYNNTVSIHCILDKDINILWANSVAQNEAKSYFGNYITKGESILKYTSPSHHEELKEKIKKVLQGTPLVYDRRIVLPGGAVIWTTINIQPLYDVNGNLLALSYSAIDNTERKASEEKVRAAQQTLSVLFDSLAQTYVLFDMNKRVTWFNMKAHDEAVELFKNPVTVGAAIDDIAPQAFVAQINDFFSRAYKGETVSYERTYPHLPGIWKQIVVGPVRDQEKNIIGVYLTSKDISELKLALESSKSNEYKMRALFDTSSDIHALFSEDNKLIWANKETVRITPRLFGVEMKLGFDIAEFVAPEYRESFLENIAKAKAGMPLNYERVYKDVSGKSVWMNVSICSIQYSEDLSKRGISFTIKDITNHKQYEERLTQVNKELVDQNQQLNQFSYIVSHNLRGPIASLMGLTSILEKELSDKVESEIIEGYKITVQRFDEIINDLTKILSQTNEADKTKSIISLDEEFSKVMDLQRGIIDQLDAKVKVDFAASKVTGVKSFVHSVFLNLLTNSIKYRREEQPLKISVKSSLYNDKVLIEFSDNGMGIDMDRHHDKLFNFYKRFHTHVDGKGLGLYLVKTQVELMGGKVEVKSKVDEGTTFFVYLPRG